MKKAKEFLQNIMKIEESKAKIKAVMNKYQEDSQDEDLSKSDLKILITEMETIISCNNKNNTVVQADTDCLCTLKKLLSNKL